MYKHLSLFLFNWDTSFWILNLNWVMITSVGWSLGKHFFLVWPFYTSLFLCCPVSVFCINNFISFPLLSCFCFCFFYINDFISFLDAGLCCGLLHFVVFINQLYVVIVEAYANCFNCGQLSQIEPDLLVRIASCTIIESKAWIWSAVYLVIGTED